MNKYNIGFLTMPKIDGYRGWRRDFKKQLNKGWNFIIFSNVKAGYARIERVGTKWVGQVGVAVGSIDIYWEKTFDTFKEAYDAVNRQKRKAAKQVFGKKAFRS